MYWSNQPSNTASRVAPTAAPRASASSVTGPKSPFVPRPPATTTAASSSVGRPAVCSLGVRDTTRTVGASTSTLSPSTSVLTGPGAGSGTTAFARTVSTATSVVNTLAVSHVPANT